MANTGWWLAAKVRCLLLGSENKLKKKAKNKPNPPHRLLGAARFQFLEAVVKRLNAVHARVVNLPGGEFVEPIALNLSVEQPKDVYERPARFDLFFEECVGVF
jgi:hypothetical protein